MGEIPLSYRIIGFVLIIVALGAGLAAGAGLFSTGANIMCVLGMIVLGLTWVVAGNKKGLG